MLASLILFQVFSFSAFQRFASLEDFPTHYPGVQVIIGAVIIGFIAWIIAKKAFNLSGSAADRLIKILEEQVKALTSERDHYRVSLHSERQELTSVTLRLKDAEGRPDLTKLFESVRSEGDRRYEVYNQQIALAAQQGEILAGVAKMQEQLVRDFENHEQQNAERHTALLLALTKLGNGFANGHSTRKKLKS